MKTQHSSLSARFFPASIPRALGLLGIAVRLVGTAVGLVITALMIMAGADAFVQNDPLVSSTQPALPGGHTPFSHGELTALAPGASTQGPLNLSTFTEVVNSQEHHPGAA